jgi:hypothetical protein
MPETIYSYLKKSYPDCSEFELREMEKDVMAYQQECADFEGNDDHFNCEE